MTSSDNRRNLKLWIGALLLLLALSAAALSALLVWELPQHVGSIRLNGEELVLGPASAGHWFVAWVGVLAALIVLVLVVPLALLLGLALPLALALVGVVLGTLVILLVSALVFSPLLLVGWLVWRATRTASTAPATIEP